jgi:glycosyltransferase involved in cell wall biosynthesis
MIVLPHPLSGTEPLVRPTHSSDVFSVGFLGRLDPKKNVDVLFRAVARLPDDVHVCVAGTGILEEKLHALAASVGIGDRVHWLRFVQGETKRRFLASIDVLVLPSAYECFGVAAAEAMQVGVPVIVSETTGIAELVRDRGGGLVVRPDVMELADAIAGIASDPQRRIALGDRAREVAARELSVETHGRRLLAAYCDLLRPTASGSDVAAAPQ